MAKTQALDSGDLSPANGRTRNGRTRQRGVVPSSEYVPIQFRMPRDFVRAFKQAALDRDMKLNELLQVVFDEFTKTAKKG